MGKRTPAIVGAGLLWLALALVPGYLVSGGAVGTISSDGDVSGSGVGLWLLGWVLSYAAVYVFDKAAGHSRAWWLVLTALLPWLVDFSLPFTPRAAVVFVVLTVLTAIGMVLQANRLSWTDRGVEQSARVIKVLPPFLHMNMVVNGVYLHRRVEVELHRPDGSTYDKTVGVLTEIGAEPVVGDSIEVLVDPKNPDRVAAKTS